MSVVPAGILLHIPDGFLHLLVAAVCWLLAVGSVAAAVANTRRDLDERLVPLAGIMAAFIFAAQMLNFPVAGGTSGHFVGAALAFIVLGPWLGLLAMTAVIAVQALLLQDGGLVAMGANILVMAVVPGFAAWMIIWAGRGRGERAQALASAVAAWLSVMLAALVVSLLLAFSGTSRLAIVLPGMLGVHAPIGLGEAAITVAALAFLHRVRPALPSDNQEAGRAGWVVAGLAVALLLVLFAPFASGYPDGLTWVAEKAGFLGAAQAPPHVLLANYAISTVGRSALSTVMAGATGVLLVAGLVSLAGRVLRRRQAAS